MKEKIIAAYLDCFNNLLTIKRFAAHHEITVEEANFIIKMGYKYHEEKIDRTFRSLTHGTGETQPAI